jgi:hypothetical protein
MSTSPDRPSEERPPQQSDMQMNLMAQMAQQAQLLQSIANQMTQLKQ